jgi:hypothetical protein
VVLGALGQEVSVLVIFLFGVGLRRAGLLSRDDGGALLRGAPVPLCAQLGIVRSAREFRNRFLPVLLTGEESVLLSPGRREPWTVVLAGAQRALIAVRHGSAASLLGDKAAFQGAIS